MRRVLIFFSALFGLFASLYLLWTYVSPSRPMVCLGSGCDIVRASEYAHPFGLPMPLYGVVLYVILALLIGAESAVATVHSLTLRRLIVGVSGVGFLGSLYLTGIEAFVLHAWCAWCVAQAIAVTVIFFVSLTLLPREQRPSAPRRLVMSHGVVLLLSLAIGVPAFRALMQKGAVAPPPPVNSASMADLVRPDTHITGNPNSTVTVVEFADFQCPFCITAEKQMRELRQRFGNRVRFAFRHYPLEKIHPFAMRAAEASECAAQQGKFWQAAEKLYGANGDLADASLTKYATALGLDMTKWNACMASGETLARIRRDKEDGQALGIRYTPTFFVGKQRIEGVLGSDHFAQIIIAQLGESQPTLTAQDNQPTPASGATTKPDQTPTAAAPVKRDSAKPQPQTNAGASIFGGSSGSPFQLVQGATDCSENAPTGPEPKMIHTSEARELFHRGSVFVDVRPKEEFEKGRIRGAINIPVTEVERRSQRLPKNKQIVLYETGGSSSDVCAMSRAVARVLFAKGFQQVQVYQDGFAAWEKEQLPSEP